MKTVKQLLDVKGYDIWSISPHASVYEAIQLMAEKNVGALAVVETGERAPNSSGLVGIISERDYARKVILKGKSSRETPVKDIMTEKVVYVRPDQTIEECMSLMTHKHIRHLPVLMDEKLIGMISIGDVVREIIAMQEDKIQFLEHYITGK